MTDAVASAPSLDVEGMLFRTALLAGYGSAARGLAARFAAVIERGTARSCFEAGAPIQLTIDAPGPPGLRIGIRLGDRLSPSALSELMPADPMRTVLDYLEPLPDASYQSLGAWLFWTAERQSVFVDLRDPSTDAAFARLQCLLDPGQRARLDALRPTMTRARPWALRVEADATSIVRVHLHWLVDRHASPGLFADVLAPGAWPRVVRTLGTLLRVPAATGRWLIATPLDDRSEPALRIGTSGWATVPENDDKHRAVGELMRLLGGPRDHAEALWSLCRSGAGPNWRVGRACELRVADSGPIRARLFFTPRVR